MAILPNLPLEAEQFAALGDFSGYLAATLASGTHFAVVPADPLSGLRMPAIGVAIENRRSGESILVGLRGYFIPGIVNTVSEWSGLVREPLFVGSGGRIVRLNALTSGMIRQQLGASFSGGLLIGFHFSGARDSSVHSGHVGSGQIASGHMASGFINNISPQLGSGFVQSGHAASGAIHGFAGVARNLASGTVGRFDLGSGAVHSGHVAPGAICGSLGSGGQLASGGIGPADIGDGAVLSGHVASGQIGAAHLASGAVRGSTMGGIYNIASGTVGENEVGSGAVRSGHLGFAAVTTLNIASGQVTSDCLAAGLLGGGGGGLTPGSVGGLFGLIRHVQSGTIGGTDLAPGAIVVGTIGSGAVTSGAIASGQIGSFHLADGSVLTLDVASGQIGASDLGSNAVVSGTIASGQIGPAHLSSGAVQSGHTASGSIVSFAGATYDASKLAGAPISGVIAVALGSGGQYVVPAQPSSGLRMPAVGVSVTNAVSGAALVFIREGFVQAVSSGTMASGAGGGLWVGSGGLLINLSGFMGGAASGPGAGAVSGSLLQWMGQAVSGGVQVSVCPAVTLATVSGTYLRCMSGAFPVSGFGRNVV